MTAIDAICEKYSGSRIESFDICIVPNFLSKVLSEADKTATSPRQLQEALEANYPVRRAGEAIVPGRVQWVEGTNAALMYRGNALKRTKIWLQRGEPNDVGFAYYYYTGVQWRVVPAQTDWEKCPEIGALVPLYDAFCNDVGAKPANQVIVTAYRNGDHNIGAHFDKPRSIAESDDDGASLITVVKIGQCGRPFELYRKGEDTPFWSKTLAPGTAVIMTLEANLATKHAVPVVDEKECGPSGSLVWRSITTVVSPEELRKKLAASDRAKEHAQGKKRARAVR